MGIKFAESYIRESQLEVVRTRLIDFGIEELASNSIRSNLVTHIYNYKTDNEKEAVNKIINRDIENIIYYVEDFHNKRQAQDGKYLSFIAYKQMFKDYANEDAPFYSLLLALDSYLTKLSNKIFLFCLNSELRITDFNQDILDLIKYLKNEKFFLLRYLTTMEYIIHKTLNLLGIDLHKLSLKETLNYPINNPFGEGEITDRARFEYSLNVVQPLLLVKTLSFKTGSETLMKGKTIIDKNHPLYKTFKEYVDEYNLLFFNYSDGLCPQNSRLLDVYYNFKNDNFIILL